MLTRSHRAPSRKTRSEIGRKKGAPPIRFARRARKARHGGIRRFLYYLPLTGLALVAILAWLSSVAPTRQTDHSRTEELRPLPEPATFEPVAVEPMVPTPAGAIDEPVAEPTTPLTLRPDEVAEAPPDLSMPAPLGIPTDSPRPTKLLLSPFKRIDTLSEEDLRKQLLRVPEIALDQVPNTSKRLFAAAEVRAGESYPGSYPGPAELLGNRAALFGMPFFSNKDCRLSTEQAKDLDQLAPTLHGYLRSCTMGTGRSAVTDSFELRRILAQTQEGRTSWRAPSACRSVLQILQVEEAPVREVLVELLSDMNDPRARAALVDRALFDVSTEVRQAAVRAMARRSPQYYRRLLLAGFRYPWPAAAAHAAEALVELNDKAAIPFLRALADELPPQVPVPVASGQPQGLALRELVRVNHLRNCLLCHPPSFDAKDPARGVIPQPDRPLVLPGEGYMAGCRRDQFVRADITYLRQDFSLFQPVEQHPKDWPEDQRFDFMVRVRTPTEADWKRLQGKQDLLKLEYRAAVEFALYELTGGGKFATDGERP